MGSAWSRPFAADPFVGAGAKGSDLATLGPVVKYQSSRQAGRPSLVLSAGLGFCLYHAAFPGPQTTRRWCTRQVRQKAGDPNPEE